MAETSGKTDSGRGNHEEILRLDGVDFSYNGKNVLQRVDLSFSKGDFAGIIGPNGAGKSTLLRCIWGICRPLGGCIRLFGKPIGDFSLRERARRMGVVFQEEGDYFDFRVKDVVAMGRYPYLKRFRGESEEDRRAVRLAMEWTDTTYLADRLITNLSSGERQRVILARSLAQDPEILCLDEPTSYLDITHKIQIFEILRTLNLRKGVTVIVISHDLNFAAEYCEKIVLLDRGIVVKEGTPHDIYQAEILSSVYGASLTVVPNPYSSAPNVLVIPGQDRSAKEGSFE